MKDKYVWYASYGSLYRGNRRTNTGSSGGTMTRLHGTEVKINDEGSGAYIPDCYQVKMQWNGQVEEFEMT